MEVVYVKLYLKLRHDLQHFSHNLSCSKGEMQVAFGYTLGVSETESERIFGLVLLGLIADG